MAQTQTESKDKVLGHLKTLAPFSVIDRGDKIDQEGGVSDCSRTGSTVHGVVRESEEEDPHTLTLEVTSRSGITASCSCSTKEEMEEQWCAHAVALIIRASELGFLESGAGFAPEESVIRMNTSSPTEIATVIEEVIGNPTAKEITSGTFTPHVRILIHGASDRLALQVYFDDTLQAPTVFEGFELVSSRALDTILLQIIEDSGSWDEDNELWFVSASDGIETILGLVGEYDEVLMTHSGEALEISKDPLDACLTIDWGEGAAQLSIEWVLSNGTKKTKGDSLIGTGPYWTFIDNTMYRLSPIAAKIASIFPHSTNLTVSRAQVGPILEVIKDKEIPSELVQITNPDLQPDCEVKTPKPVVDIERIDDPHQHFSSSKELTLCANLEFDYPTPPEGKNLVYLPDRERERDFREHLKKLGFTFLPDKRRFEVAGDLALDLTQAADDAFPKPWKVSGLKEVNKQLRFSNLSVNVTVAPDGDEVDEKGKKIGGGSLDWFECHISLLQNNANVPISTLFKKALPGSDKWVRLDNGSFAKVPGGGLNELKANLGMLDPNFRLSNSIRAKLSTAQAIGLSRLDTDQFNVSVDRSLRGLAKKLKDFETIAKLKEPKRFEGKLRDYQRDGLSWLNFLNDFKLGGILADEMGLGKTVQTLSLLQHLKDSRAKDKKLEHPALIVAPTSVIMNWFYEARRFAPKLEVLVLHGPNRKKLFQDISKYDIVITSYALLRLDRYDLERAQYSYLILDEAQNIKNPQTATTKAAKALRAQHRLALTGTPTENRPMELWSIMDFLMPGFLGSREFFRSSIERPIIEGTGGNAAAALLRAKTRPFILRRMKSDVEKDLPPKIESSLHVEMAPSQMELYAQILEEVRPRVFEAVEKRGVRAASVSILSALLRLRQVCNHPNSIDSLKEEPGYESGKFNLLKDLTTEAIESGRKILLFCQFREMLSIIRKHLEESGYKHLYLDGATKDRQDLVDQFNSDEDVRIFLISLKAGGTGLNLTAADTVIIYDPWWNPAVESQAVDRAHRIGQKKAVSVYRLVTENSIEQKIMDLKERKSKLVDALINDNGLSTLSLSKTDLAELFSPLSTGATLEQPPE